VRRIARNKKPAPAHSIPTTPIPSLLPAISHRSSADGRKCFCLPPPRVRGSAEKLSLVPDAIDCSPPSYRRAIAPFRREAQARRMAATSIADSNQERCFSAEPRTRGGGRQKHFAAISRRTVRNGRKQGRDWCGGNGVSGCWLLISSYASHRGLTLAPDEHVLPRPRSFGSKRSPPNFRKTA